MSFKNNHAMTKQEDSVPLEKVAVDFHRNFARNDYFKLGCALCILLSDDLLTRPQRLVAYLILCECQNDMKPFLPFFLEAVENGTDGCERQFLKTLLTDAGDTYRKSVEKSAKAGLGKSYFVSDANKSQLKSSVIDALQQASEPYLQACEFKVAHNQKQ